MRKALRGFTMIEVVVIITVIGILSTIGVVSYVNIQQDSRDKQRLHQVTVIGEAIEKFYDNNGRYPTCLELKTNPTTTLSGIDENVLIAPTAISNSISCETADPKPVDKKDVFYYSDTEIETNGAWKLTHFSEKEGGESPNFISNRRNNTTIAVNSTFALSYSASPAGSGSITGTPVDTHNKGTTINLKAVPNDGKKFVYWSGDTCPANLQTKVEIRFAITKVVDCVANFVDDDAVIVQRTLKVSVLPAGAGTVNGVADINDEYNNGTDVPLTAKSTNDNKWVFSGWSSCSNLTNEDITVTMDNNKTCTANFTEKKYKLTVTILPAGAGTVVGAGEYEYGEEIELKATPGVGYSTGVWTEDCNAAGKVTMDSDKNCTATFGIDTPIMNDVTVSGSDNSTWSWNPVTTCPNEYKASYQYNYTSKQISNSLDYSDTGWILDTDINNPDSFLGGNQTGFKFSLNSISNKYEYKRYTGYNDFSYTVKVKARCSKTIGGTEYKSDWSDPKSASYDRPIPDYTLTLTAGTGGSVLGNGPITANTTTTITATPSAGYYFDSWTGSAGCATSPEKAVHEIKMDDHKSCKANFVINKPTMSTVITNTIGDNTTWSWNGVACPTGALAIYQYYYETSSGYKEIFGSPQTVDGTLMYSTGETSYTRSTKWVGNTYDLKVRAKCVNNANISVNSDWSEPNSAVYKRPLSRPVMSEVSATGAANNTVWRWKSVSCPAGSTTDYHYRYTTSGATNYDSKWQPESSPNPKDSIAEGIATGYIIGYNNANTSWEYTRQTYWKDYTYKLEVQARCLKTINGVEETSEWSESKSASYVRAMATPTMNDLILSSDDSDTTWSWRSSSCPIGYTDKYHYRYYSTKTSNGEDVWDSEWQPESNKPDSVSEGVPTGYVFSSTLLSQPKWHYKRFTGWSGYFYTVEVQTKCSKVFGDIESEWSESKSATFTRDESSIPAPAAPAINTYFSEEWSWGTKYYANFEWKSTCPANSTTEYSIDYSNNHGGSTESNKIQSGSLYKTRMNQDEGNFGSISVKARCNFNNMNTAWGATGYASISRGGVSNPSTPVWSDLERTTYKDSGVDYDALRITATTGCGIGSALYSVADLYSPSPYQNYNPNQTPNFYSGWYGNDTNISTWLFSPFKRVTGSSIGLTMLFYEYNPATGVTSAIPAYPKRGSEFYFRAKFYCQTSHTPPLTSATITSYSGMKAAP